MKLLKFSCTCLTTLFLFTIPLTAQDNTSTKEIRIQLSTTSNLCPIYSSKIIPEDNFLPISYLQELEKVFEYDFNNNGKTKILLKNYDKERLLTLKDNKICFNPKEWQSNSAKYVIRLSVKEKMISSQIYEVQSGSIKTLEPIPLNGILSEDRRKIHKLSDQIHKMLFNVDGISNTRILYSYQQQIPGESSKFVSEIWECDWDGANAKQLTKEGSYIVTPVLIPKGGAISKDMFLYVTYKTGQPKIYISSVDSPKGVKAVDIRGNQLLPAISSKRDMLAFVCDASGRADLFVQPIEPHNGKMGKPVQLFSYPRSTQASPTFSPDSTKIAFASDKDGSTRIYIIPCDRTEKRAVPQLITKKNRENSCPSWSPDGTKLAYSAKTDGIRQIWIYDFSSGEERQLTFGGGNKENPCWAQNSQHLIFNSTDADSSDLYVVNLNQPDAIRITKGPGKKHYPTWGPR